MEANNLYLMYYQLKSLKIAFLMYLRAVFSIMTCFIEKWYQYNFILWWIKPCFTFVATNATFPLFWRRRLIRNTSANTTTTVALIWCCWCATSPVCLVFPFEKFTYWFFTFVELSSLICSWLIRRQTFRN